MKKILAIVLSIFYFGLSSGAVFSTHYCMNELASLSQDSQKTCGICGSEKKNNCCKTEFKILKTDQSQKANLLVFAFTPQFSEIVQHHFKILTPSFFEEKLASIQINAPPERGLVPIFIQHCNFRI